MKGKIYKYQQGSGVYTPNLGLPAPINPAPIIQTASMPLDSGLQGYTRLKQLDLQERRLATVKDQYDKQYELNLTNFKLNLFKYLDSATGLSSGMGRTKSGSPAWHSPTQMKIVQDYQDAKRDMFLDAFSRDADNPEDVFRQVQSATKSLDDEFKDDYNRALTQKAYHDRQLALYQEDPDKYDSGLASIAYNRIATSGNLDERINMLYPSLDVIADNFTKNVLEKREPISYDSTIDADGKYDILEGNLKDMRGELVMEMLTKAPQTISHYWNQYKTGLEYDLSEGRITSEQYNSLVGTDNNSEQLALNHWLMNELAPRLAPTSGTQRIKIGHNKREIGDIGKDPYSNIRSGQTIQVEGFRENMKDGLTNYIEPSFWEKVGSVNDIVLGTTAMSLGAHNIASDKFAEAGFVKSLTPRQVEELSVFLGDDELNYEIHNNEKYLSEEGYMKLTNIINNLPESALESLTQGIQFEQLTKIVNKEEINVDLSKDSEYSNSIKNELRRKGNVIFDVTNGKYVDQDKNQDFFDSEKWNIVAGGKMTGDNAVLPLLAIGDKGRIHSPDIGAFDVNNGMYIEVQNDGGEQRSLIVMGKDIPKVLGMSSGEVNYNREMSKMQTKLLVKHDQKVDLTEDMKQIVNIDDPNAQISYVSNSEDSTGGVYRVYTDNGNIDAKSLRSLRYADTIIDALTESESYPVEGGNAKIYVQEDGMYMALYPKDKEGNTSSKAIIISYPNKDLSPAESEQWLESQFEYRSEDGTFDNSDIFEDDLINPSYRIESFNPSESPGIDVLKEISDDDIPDKDALYPTGGRDAGMRTDRHNNMLAVTTDVAKQAGVPYKPGDVFYSNGKTYRTAILEGDPIDTAIKILDEIGFYTRDGRTKRWDHTSMGTSEWRSLPRWRKEEVVRKMYAQEGGIKFK